jgi:hypothetical protein
MQSQAPVVSKTGASSKVFHFKLQAESSAIYELPQREACQQQLLLHELHRLQRAQLNREALLQPT